MPDISMCPGDGCAMRGGCYRAMATPNSYQTYLTTPPCTSVGVCDFYWPTIKPPFVKYDDQANNFYFSPDDWEAPHLDVINLGEL